MGGMSSQVSGCLENSTGFFLLPSLMDFEAAKVTCVSRNATLARVSSAEEQNFIASLLRTNEVQGEIWIGICAMLFCTETHFSLLGLEDLNQTGGRDPTRFTFVDGSSEGLDFFAQNGIFPWDSSNPDDRSGNQFCVL